MICTLGNFSTKLLRGDPTGITRVHGQVQVRTIGARAVRLYPLYHPAAALYTPSTLELCAPTFTGSRSCWRSAPPSSPEPLGPDRPSPRTAAESIRAPSRGAGVAAHARGWRPRGLSRRSQMGLF